MSVFKEIATFFGIVSLGIGVMSVAVPISLVTSTHVLKALEKKFPLDLDKLLLFLFLFL